METLEQLKEIVKNAPEGKTMVSECYGVYYYWSGRDLSDLSMRCESVYGVLRSLSDIKLIIEFMEGQKKACQAYATLEEVKQKYNGENKIAKELLKLAYECDEFSLSGDLRKDIKEFLGDL